MLRTFSAAALAASLLSVSASAAPLDLGSTSKEAIQHAREALTLMEQNAPGPRVRESAQKAVTADPDFALGHLLVALTYGGNSPDRKANIEKAKAAAAKAPKGVQDLITASTTADRDAAITAFETLDKEYDDPLISIRLGQLYLERYMFGKSDLEKARAAFEAGAQLEAKSARAQIGIANTLMLKGDYAGARERLASAQSLLAPGAVLGQVRYGTAMSYLYEGKPQEAIKTLEHYITEYKGSPNLPFPEVFIHNSIARIHLESGNGEAALANYEKGFEAVKNSTTMKEEDKKIWLGRLHHGRGRSLARLGKHKEAWAEAETVKKMIDEAGEAGKPYLEAYHYLAGYLKLEAGETQAAIEHLQQADAEDPFHRLLLARAYEKAGQKEKARATYQEVVDSKQNNIERALSYPEAKKKLL